MSLDRRQFLAGSAGLLGFAGLGRLWAGDPPPAFGGGLVADPQRVIALPAGFRYRIIGRTGDAMADGLVLPARPDGMAAFAGPDGLTLVVRNHEMDPGWGLGPFGEGNRLVGHLPAGRLFDAGGGKTPALGGTTTFVYDTSKGELVRQFLSLAGPLRNCAGGPTPWGSWISCEETTQRAGPFKNNGQADQDHGWCFDVQATAEPALAEPRPIRGLGRFNHEAIAIHPTSGVVYLTEDRHDGLLYRFLPKDPQDLHAGGRLQALVVAERPSLDTRNWRSRAWAVGSTERAHWIDLVDTDAPKDDLRHRGHATGAAVFARGEGMWAAADGDIWFTATSGGPAQAGQVWRLRETEGGDRLDLFWEAQDKSGPVNIDNLTVAPDGSLLLCEDRQGRDVRLIRLTADGQLSILAHNHLRSEFAGACVSPDQSTVFVNIQGPGLTLAIAGPWPWL